MKVGGAIATKAGQLSTRFVIHAPTMARPAMRIDVGNVRSAMQAALEMARNLEVKSIAFPGLGTGVGGLTLETAANIMMQELKEHLNGSTTLNEVIFLGHTAEASEEFGKAVFKNFRMSD